MNTNISHFIAERLEVLDCVPVGLCLIDRNYRILYWNRCLEDWSRRSRQQILGHPLDEYLPHLKGPRYTQRINGLFDGGAPAIFSAQLHNNLFNLFEPDGHPRIQHITATAVPALERDEYWALFAIEDITDLTRRISDYRNAQKQLRQAYDEMEARVDRRTQDLAVAVEKLQAEVAERKRTEQVLADTNRELKAMQSQIIQNEKMASIGQLAAGVAHEMNTPVGFVASNFQTLQGYMKKFLDLFEMYESLHTLVEGGDKQTRLEMMQQISQARQNMKIDFILEDLRQLFEESAEGLQRVTTIIQNLRDFSRIDHAEDFTDYNLNDGINTTLVMARNAIKYEADVVLELGSIPPAHCNAGQINQVLLNILVNAAQAIGDQKNHERGTITIRTEATEDEIICTIADNGPGIDPIKIDHIFEPFFTTKPAGKGTGLGLSVSYDIIVNKHKGSLSVKSELGQGTTFTLCLPRQTQTQNHCFASDSQQPTEN